MICFLLPFFWGCFVFIKQFNKKIFPLLSLEMLMISLICSFFCFGESLSNYFSYSYSFIFLILMVLDSVLGISLLIFSSRFSEKCSLSLA